MKKVLLFFLLSVSTLSFAQNLSINIDYEVDYLIPNNNRANDTITIGFSEDGRFLWTNYRPLAKDFAKSMIKDQSLIEKADANFILKTETGDLILAFNLGDNEIYFNINIGLFLPVEEEPENAPLNLVIEKSDTKVELFNKQFDSYKIFPEGDPTDAILMVVDNEYPMNNNLIFGKFFEIALELFSPDSSIETNFPNGIVLHIGDKSGTMIEALSVKEVNKQLDINYSFEIKE